MTSRELEAAAIAEAFMQRNKGALQGLAQGILPGSADWQGAFDRHLAHTSAEPIGIVVDRASGPYIFAKDGTRYLDLIAGIGVALFLSGLMER